LGNAGWANSERSDFSASDVEVELLVVKSTAYHEAVRYFGIWTFSRRFGPVP
jgi:hypothetical protein